MEIQIANLHLYLYYDLVVPQFAFHYLVGRVRDSEILFRIYVTS